MDNIWPQGKLIWSMKKKLTSEKHESISMQTRALTKLGEVDVNNINCH